MSGITFEVRAVPSPQGSKRHVGNGIMVESAGQKLKSWREAVRFEAVAAARGVTLTAADWASSGHPIAVIVRFNLPRPKSHYRTGEHANELRADAPSYAAKRPDVDKLVRSTLDALTAAGLYHDDAQVAVLEVEKRYADPDPVGAVITVSPVHA